MSKLYVKFAYNLYNMKAHSRTSNTKTNTIIDRETGEILSQTTNKDKYLAGSKEEFYLMYSSMVIILKSSSDVRMKLFASLLERYSKGVEFGMSADLKKIIASETGCSPRSLDSAMTDLVEKNIIVKLGRSLYRINPRHIFQGSSDNRNRELLAVIELHCPNC